jgi:hypothetical protein
MPCAGTVRRTIPIIPGVHTKDIFLNLMSDCIELLHVRLHQIMQDRPAYDEAVS